MTNEEKEQIRHKLKRRVKDIEYRLNTPNNWTNGELELYKRELKAIRLRLKAIDLN